MEFIDKVLKIMEEKKITAYKLCKETGLSQQSFNNWKTGKIPSINKAITVINYLGVSADDIFEIKINKNKLTETETEMIEVMNRMSEKYQWRAIGIVEDYADKHPKEESIEENSKKLSESKIS